MMRENLILVGDKPIMRYVDVAIIKFTNDGINNIIIKARGTYISRAVDVAEVTKRKLDYVKVKDVVIENFEKSIVLQFSFKVLLENFDKIDIFQNSL